MASEQARGASGDLPEAEPVTFRARHAIRTVNHLVRDETERSAPADADGWSEEELARRAVTQDEDAWRVVFERHYRGVYAFARYRLGSPEEADDVASQVFEVAYTRADRFDYRGVPIGAWLTGIARNLVRDRIKRRSRRGIEAELVDAVTPIEPDRSASVGDRQDLGAALGHLTEDQQTVIYHRFICDRPVADTAILMERSEDAIKNLQRRALAAMQRALVGAGYERGLSSGR